MSKEKEVSPQKSAFHWDEINHFFQLQQFQYKSLMFTTALVR